MRAWSRTWTAYELGKRAPIWPGSTEKAGGRQPYWPTRVADTRATSSWPKWLFARRRFRDSSCATANVFAGACNAIRRLATPRLPSPFSDCVHAFSVPLPARPTAGSVGLTIFAANFIPVDVSRVFASIATKWRDGQKLELGAAVIDMRPKWPDAWRLLPILGAPAAPVSRFGRHVAWRLHISSTTTTTTLGSCQAISGVCKTTPLDKGSCNETESANAGRQLE